MTNFSFPLAEVCRKQNKVFAPSGIACDNLLLNNEKNIPGCYCDNNLVLHEETGECIPKDQCGCIAGDKEYKKGDVSPGDCSL